MNSKHITALGGNAHLHQNIALNSNTLLVSHQNTIKHLSLLFMTCFILAACSEDKGIRNATPVVTEKKSHKDSLYLKCLGDIGFVEKTDTIILDKGILTCRLGKYENCACSILDTFYLKNDTLDIELTSPGKEQFACDCYFEMYARLNYHDKKPKSITINGHPIGSGHGIVVKED